MTTLRYHVHYCSRGSLFCHSPDGPFETPRVAYFVHNAELYVFGSVGEARWDGLDYKAKMALVKERTDLNVEVINYYPDLQLHFDHAESKVVLSDLQRELSMRFDEPNDDFFMALFSYRSTAHIGLLMLSELEAIERAVRLLLLRPSICNLQGLLDALEDTPEIDVCSRGQFSEGGLGYQISLRCRGTTLTLSFNSDYLMYSIGSGVVMRNNQSYKYHMRGNVAVIENLESVWSDELCGKVTDVVTTLVKFACQPTDGTVSKNIMLRG